MNGECDVPAPNEGFVAISAGRWFSLGLKNDGTIVAWGHNVSGQCDVPVSSIDFFPTICNWLDVDIPDTLVIDGKDITPLLKGGNDIGRQDLYWHFPHYWWGQFVRPYSIVRSGDWKLIKFWEGGEELYNLKDDISETVNLAEIHPGKRIELEKKLDNWLKETGAKLPRPNPEK